MSEPFIAEIRIFAGNFAPRNWAFCDGQLYPIAQNTALFSLVGTIYGGDGRTTFGVPDLQGRAPMHPGRGPGLTPRQLGERGGVDTMTLTTAQMSAHRHNALGTTALNTDDNPEGNSWGRSEEGYNYRQTADGNSNLGSSAFGTVGASQAHNNVQPFLTLNFIIALIGVFPSRS
jgi:microcystin-dependent protein